MSLRHADIDLEAFNDILSRYPSTITKISDGKQKRKSSTSDADDSLEFLDTWRLDVLPKDLAARREADKTDDCLKKEEVEKLIRWKLKHGTFRPSLLKLVASNSEETIRKTTAHAFDIASKVSDKKHESIANKIMEAIAVLVELKGIGPASASLLLSVRLPRTVPFFSDEAYRWLTGTTGDPWKAGIKYIAKEFRAMLCSSLELCQRLPVGAIDVERVGWVLGHKESNLDLKVSEPVVRGSKRKQEETQESDVMDGPADESVQATQPAPNTRYSKRVKR